MQINLSKQPVKEKIDFLLRYYNSSRGSGHTKTMWGGANSAMGYLVVPSHAIYKNLTQNFGPLMREMSLDDLESLRGANHGLPLIWDNTAIVSILKESLDEIVKLEAQIPKSEDNKVIESDNKDKEIEQLKLMNKQLVSVIDNMNQLIGGSKK